MVNTFEDSGDFFATRPDFTYPDQIIKEVDKLFDARRDDFAHALLDYCDQIGEEDTIILASRLESVPPVGSVAIQQQVSLNLFAGSETS